MVSVRVSRALGWMVALAVGLAIAPRIVRANGLELLPGGTRSVARGGAVAARPEDPMAMLHNPAGLAFVPGDQFMFDLDISVHDMCVDPYGFYGWGVYEDDASDFGDPLEVELDDDGRPIIGATYATTPLPEVCNSAPVAPLPQIAWATHLSDSFTIGFGMVAPTVVTGLQYGADDGTIQTADGGRPTPTRYQLIRQKVDFALAPSFGAAFRPLRQLSFGANLQVAMLSATTRAIQNLTTGTQPSQDWLVDVKAEDYFIPSLTFGVHVRPVPQLDLTANVRVVDDFDGTGEVVYETNTFHAENDQIGQPTPFVNDPIDLALVEVSVPWAVTVGARYAGLLPGVDPDDLRWDPMARELWDVELDVTYNLNERAGQNRVRAGEDVTVITRDVGGGGDSQSVPLDDLSRLSIERHMRDSIAVRLGGSYSVLPRKLQVHAGSFYESRAVDIAYAHVESFAFQRIGFGLGLMARFGSWDLMAGYAHVFSETVELAPPPHEPADQFDPDDPTSGFDQRVGGTFTAAGEREGGFELPDPDAPSPGEADAVAREQQTSAVPSPARADRVVNAGRYRAAFDIVSVGVTYHF